MCAHLENRKVSEHDLANASKYRGITLMTVGAKNLIPHIDTRLRMIRIILGKVGIQLRKYLLCIDW